MVGKHHYAAYRQLHLRGTNAKYKRFVEYVKGKLAESGIRRIEVDAVGGRTVQFTFAMVKPSSPDQIPTAKELNELRADAIMSEIEKNLKKRGFPVDRK